MKKRNTPPYLTSAEIVRVLFNILGVEIPKKLKEDCRSSFVNLNAIEDYLNTELAQALTTYASKEAANSIVHFLHSVLEDYHELVRNVPLDGVPRGIALQQLASDWVSFRLAGFILPLRQTFPDFHIFDALSPEKSAVELVLEWGERNCFWWGNLHKAWSKDQKTQMSKYKNGVDIPTLGSIKLLFPENGDGMSDIRTLLILARACDDLKRRPFGPQILRATIEHLLVKRHSIDFGEQFSALQIKCSERYEALKLPTIDLDEDLRPQKSKPKPAEQQTLERLEQLKESFHQYDPEGETRYFLNWLEAKWFVFAGDLQAANEKYQSAMELALFRAGKNQEMILNEAFAVAAMVNDRVFLKKLKQICILFKFSIPLLSEEEAQTMRRSKAEDFIEEWEIENWKHYFSKIFPKYGWFTGVDIERQGHVGPLLYVEGDIQPDFAKANRKIKVQWKTFPQLVFFTHQNQFDIVKKLLSMGANVDLLSSSNESALLLAVEMMDCFEATYRPQDDSLFWLLSEHKHKSSTINAITPKKKLTPVFSAINSCRPDIVQKLVEMGASVNRRAGLENVTPLYFCLSRIGLAKSPGMISRNRNDIDALDSIRRHTNGMLGPTLQHQQQAMLSSLKTGLERNVLKSIHEMYIQGIGQNASLDGLRAIAHYLIENGADIHALEKKPINGYSPLMLAIENDEPELVELLLQKGADLKRTYRDNRNGEKIDCWRIARGFGSHNALKVLENWIGSVVSPRSVDT